MKILFLLLFLLFERDLFSSHRYVTKINDGYTTVVPKKSWLHTIGFGCDTNSSVYPEIDHIPLREHKIVPILESINLEDLNLHMSVQDHNTIATMDFTDRSLASVLDQPHEFVIKKKPVKKSSVLEIFMNQFRSSPDINRMNSQGWTPLQQAAYQGDIQVVMQLIKAGADINMQNNDGDTALHLALKNTNSCIDTDPFFTIFICLLDNHADVHKKNNAGKTPLHCAVQSLHAQAVPVLLDCGVDINARDNQGYTPLMTAIRKDFTSHTNGQLLQQQAEIIRLLLHAGADISIVGIDKRLPVDDINYHIKSHSMLPIVADYIADVYQATNKKALPDLW